QDFIRPFDLAEAPLIRAGLVAMEPSRHLLMVDMHHIISDGVSHFILVRDFMALYQGKELPPVKVRYRDYAEWQNSHEQKEDIKKQREFWLHHFKGEIPVLDIPIDFPRGERQSFEGKTLDFRLHEDQPSALKDLASSEGVTLYALLLSIFNVFISKITGQEDIIIGSPVAGRRHADLETLIGMFVNTLAIRNRTDRNDSFKRLLHQVKSNTVKAFENQDYPFEELVHQLGANPDLNRNPLFHIP
ncbi:MAG: hypothetical protein GY940_45180, partial [bacterium]|nr:hypothetical protein [bacterium]